MYISWSEIIIKINLYPTNQRTRDTMYVNPKSSDALAPNRTNS